MYFLYSILLGIGVLALLPRFLLDAARHGKYAAGLSERAGSLPRFDAGGQPVVWLHCVSVGEAQAARPLARALLEEYPHHALVVTTTTLTGQRVAREAFKGQAARVFYFPFDWAWSVRRALRALNPSVVLLMETELWPRFFRECRRRGVPLALVNGRISEKSFGRYRLIRPFIRTSSPTSRSRPRRPKGTPRGSSRLASRPNACASPATSSSTSRRRLPFRLRKSCGAASA